MYSYGILKRIRNFQNKFENFVGDIEEEDDDVDIPEEEVNIFNTSSYIFWIIIIFLVIGVMIIFIVVYKLFYSNSDQVQYYDTAPIQHIQQPMQKNEQVIQQDYNQNQYREYTPPPIEKYQPKQQNNMSSLNSESSFNSETTLPKYNQNKSQSSSFWENSENSRDK